MYVSFNRGDNTKMNNTPITDGLIFINTEESEIFFDNGDTRISFLGGSSGGGHVIQNPAGTSMAQEPNMQFEDAHITDDSTNEKTIVEVTKEVTASQFTNLPVDGSADGFYLVSDGQGGNSISAEDIPYDNTDSGMTATNAQDAIDELSADTSDLDVYSTVYQKTLTTGSTSVTFTNDLIDSDSCFYFYADQAHSDLLPSSWSVSNHTLTVTYTAQSANVVVGVQIMKGVVVSG